MAIISFIKMEPYHRHQSLKQEDASSAADEHKRRSPVGQEQDQSKSGPAYYSAEDRRHQYYQHHQHYYPPPPPPPPPSEHPYSHYNYPHHQYYYHAAPPVPTPDARYRPPSASAAPVTDDTKLRQDDNDDDERKRPARLNARDDSDGSRKLDPYEPIPWAKAQSQPMLAPTEAQAYANRVLPAPSPAPSKKTSPVASPVRSRSSSSYAQLKSPSEDLSYSSIRKRDTASFSPITFNHNLVAGSQYERADSIWDIRFKELSAFKAKYGHCNVPQKYPANKSLGIWVNKQRMEYNKRIDGKKKSSLNDSRLERLQSLGFRWAKRKGQASWENHFDALVAYKAENGHCSVPTKYKEDTALGRWVSTQRAEYKKYSEGELSQITADKIKRLEDVGFAWWMGV